MRAVLVEHNQLTSNDTITVTGDMYEHLVRVARVRVGENVKILNGRGLVGMGEVSHIDKKAVTVKVDECSYENNTSKIDLAICVPKKEAYELVLKQSAELRIGRIIPVISEYATKNSFNLERITRVIESGVLQSNCSWAPVVASEIDFESFLSVCAGYEMVIYFSSISNSTIGDFNHKSKKILMIVGPEGGLAPFEEGEIGELPNCLIIHLPTNILRTPTAVSCGVGFIHGCPILA